ncbi:MAG: hypothetical protein DMF06_01265 [Verrucomicrobia bacterium]|nr:MAG: hypothetical protein DMF06_01265 [Verrucomicrobiota bacterium]
MLPEPSLQVVCICKSPRSDSFHRGLAERIRRASARARKSRRSGGALVFLGGCSSQLRSFGARNGPMPLSSRRDRPSRKISAARSGQRKALRAALLKARCRIPSAPSASRARSSAISQFDKAAFMAKAGPNISASHSFAVRNAIARAFRNPALGFRIEDQKNQTGAAVRRVSTDMDKKNRGKTLVTGASSGIGLHLAHEFAKRGHPLVLVAPVESELREIATQFQLDHGISVQIMAKDLREESAAREIFDQIQRDATPLEILVNNAAHGQRGKFWEIPIETDISMVDLNILAYLRLTKLFLPSMVQRGRGRILNTASVAGFMPGPLQAVYHATKAFVLSWSEALATELDKTGVTVTALCPGPTDTDFFEKADMQDTKAFQSVMAPQEVAKTGYEALMEGKNVVIAGAVNKAMVFSRHLMPASGQARLNEKMYEQIPPEEQKLKRGDKEFAAAAREEDPVRIF